MRYLLLIYDDEKTWAALSPEESAGLMKDYFDYTAWLQEKGFFVAGDALQATGTAKTVRVRDGEQLVSDGPFAETKEQLGGYYLLEVSSEAEALDAAGRLPSARIGSVEVRPIMEVPEAPPQG